MALTASNFFNLTESFYVSNAITLCKINRNRNRDLDNSNASTELGLNLHNICLNYQNFAAGKTV